MPERNLEFMSAAEYLRRLGKWKYGDISDDGFVKMGYDG